MAVAAALSRRLVLRGGLAAAAAASLARPLPARAADADLVLVSLADLHSPYLQLPRLLAQVRAIVASATSRVIVLINGDVFERGNVVALRSGGAADLAFLRALADFVETIINLGNHETALHDDPRDALAAIAGAHPRLRVISSLIDARTGDSLVQPAAVFSFPGGELPLLGVGTDQMATYRAAPRGLLLAPRPASWVETWLPRVSRQAKGVIVASHAGVQADKEILGATPPGALVIGGHDHLRFDATDGAGRRLFHGGSWGNHLRIVSIFAGGDAPPRFAIEERAVDAAPDAALAAEIARLEQQHLTAEDRAPVASLPRSYDLSEAAIVAADAVRKAAGADVGFVNHTSFGDGLPRGAVDRYRYDSFLRFDGDIRVATVDGAALAAILRRANQFRAATLEERTGDFVYANALAIDPSARYRIAANGWTTMNQQAYLGVTGLTFAPVADLRVKTVVARALAEIGK